MSKEDDSHQRMVDMEAHDRPRERLADVGARSLRDAELLAILLRVGATGENVVRQAERLIAEIGGLRGLHRASYTDVSSISGVGPAKAAQLLAAVELGRRMAIQTPEERPVINSPADAAQLLMYSMSALEQEYLFALLLDTRNRVIGEPVEIYHGSVNTSLIRTGEIFREAVKVNATGLIVLHNHPSGDPSPSPEDIAVTRALIEAGKLLDIDLIDHLIIGQQRFVSLKERGLGFGNT